MVLVWPTFDLSSYCPAQRRGTDCRAKRHLSRLLYLSHYQNWKVTPASVACMTPWDASSFCGPGPGRFIWKSTAAETVAGTAPVRRGNALPKLVPPISPWNLIVIDLLGPLPKSTTASQVTIFKTDRYRKLSWSILPSKTTGQHVASVIFDRWMRPKEVIGYLLTYNGPQIVS